MGYRKGVKRSDRRWIDDDGSEWDSKFECDVYRGLARNGHRVRRADEGDTIAYNSKVKNGRCVECCGDNVVQDRIYNADLYVVTDKEDPEGEGYLVECKGVWLGPKRNLFRSVAGQLQGTNLRIVFQANRRMKGTKMTPVEYCHRYTKNIIPGLWDNKNKRIEWFEC